MDRPSPVPRSVSWSTADPDPAGTALHLARKSGFRDLAALANAHLVAGALADAARYAEEAVDVHRATGNRHAEARAAHLLSQAGLDVRPSAG